MIGEFELKKWILKR